MHPNVPVSASIVIEAIAAHPDVEAVILFGSRARGDHDERSDIDIAIRAPRMTRYGWAHLRDRTAMARSLFWISLVHFDRNPPALVARILQTGTLIYAKKA